MKGLLDTLEKFKSEFESVDRPPLEFEAPPIIRGKEKEPASSKPKPPRISSFLSQRRRPPKELNLESTPVTVTENETQRGGLSLSFSPTIALPLVRSRSAIIPHHNEEDEEEHHQLESLVMISAKKCCSDAEAQLSMLKMELELESHHSRSSSMDGIIDWEFDEKFEKDQQERVMSNNTHADYYSP